MTLTCVVLRCEKEIEYFRPEDVTARDVGSYFLGILPKWFSASLFCFPPGGEMRNQEFSWLSVRVPTEKHEEIKAQATRTGVTVSDIVRMALDGTLVVVRGNNA